jgi:hypothetical protein
MREQDESRECRQCRTVCAGIPRISQSTSEKWGELLSFMRVGASRWGMGPFSVTPCDTADWYVHPLSHDETEKSHLVKT